MSLMLHHRYRLARSAHFAPAPTPCGVLHTILKPVATPIRCAPTVACASSAKGEDVISVRDAAQQASTSHDTDISDRNGLPARSDDAAHLSCTGQHASSSSKSGIHGVNGNGSVSSTSLDQGVDSLSEAAAPSTTSKGVGQYGWLAFWIGSAIIFGAGVWLFEGHTKGKEFFAGYLLEQCLSLDNLFVFQIVFQYFKTPVSGQAAVLAYGIATAAALRAILIVAGVQLVQQWKPILAVFAGILLFSSFKLLTDNGEDEEEDLQNNAVIAFCKRFIKTTDTYDGDKFFTTLADGTVSATPLLLALAVVELSDVVFALDSIPAVFGVTLDPFIVYTSNIFAILSLRAVFQFASSVMMQARYLDKAVAVVLGFIGAKMLLEFAHVDIPTDLSLLFVALTLGGGVAAGYLLPETAGAKPEER